MRPDTGRGLGVRALGRARARLLPRPRSSSLRRCDLAGVNPLVATGTRFSHEVLDLLFPELLAESAGSLDQPPSFAPALAESWDLSSDRRRLLVRLREGLRWSDGDPVTARDVVFTHRAETDGDVAWPYSDSKAGIEEVRAIDDRTVLFRLRPGGAFALVDVNDGADPSRARLGNPPLRRVAARRRLVPPAPGHRRPLPARRLAPGRRAGADTERAVARSGPRCRGSGRLPRRARSRRARRAAARRRIRLRRRPHAARRRAGGAQPASPPGGGRGAPVRLHRLEPAPGALRRPARAPRPDPRDRPPVAGRRALARPRPRRRRPGAGSLLGPRPRARALAVRSAGGAAAARRARLRRSRRRRHRRARRTTVPLRAADQRRAIASAPTPWC